MEVARIRSFIDTFRKRIEFESDNSKEAFQQLKEWKDKEYLSIRMASETFRDASENFLTEVGVFLQAVKPNKFSFSINMSQVKEAQCVFMRKAIFSQCSNSTHVFFSLRQPSEEFFSRSITWLSTFNLIGLSLVGVGDVVIPNSALHDLKAITTLRVLDVSDYKQEQAVANLIEFLCTEETSIQLLRFTNCKGTDSDELRKAIHVCKANKRLVHGIEVFDNHSLKWVNFAHPEASNSVEAEPFDQNGLYAEIDQALKTGAKCPFGRSKLLVVGKGRAGKTSLVKALMHGVFKAKEESTKGVKLTRIDVSNWKQTSSSYMVEHMQYLFSNADEPRGKKGKPIVQLQSSKKKGKDEQGAVKTPGGKQLISQAPLETVRADHDTGSKPSDKREPYELAVPMQDIKEYGRSLIAHKKDQQSLKFTIWDFGGQLVFYTLHHVFLTEYGCYILVFNLLNLLNQKLQSEATEYLKFWLFSIKIHAPSAPVILVGSHCFGLSSDDLKEANSVIRNEVLLKSSFSWTENANLHFFPVDSEKHAGIPVLRTKIQQVVARQAYINEAVPLRFLYMFEQLMKLKKDYATVDEVAISTTNSGLSSKELLLALMFLNQRGLLTYFSDPAQLSRLIILKPSWLINALTCVIYDNTIHDHSVYSPKYRNQFLRFQNDQIISNELLMDIWSNAGYSAEEGEFVKLLMVHMLLMCAYSYGARDSYLVPTLMTLQISSKSEPQQSLFLRDFQGPHFVLDFSGDFNEAVVQDAGIKFARYLPHGFFERLVCLCIRKSAEYKDRLVPKLSSYEATFSFGTLVTLHMMICKNDKEERLWVRGSAENDALHEKVLYAGQLLYSMAKGIAADFFSKTRESCSVPVSLLLSSSKETGHFLARFEKLEELMQSSNQDLFFPSPLENRKMRACDYEEWFSQKTSLEIGSSFKRLFKKDKRLLSLQNQVYRPLPKKTDYHCFLSYKQHTGMELVGKQFFILTNLGYKCWYDQHFKGEITLESMLTGVRQSMCYVLFLTKDVFPSKYVEHEISLARELKKPIILLHHPKTETYGYWTFRDYIEHAPPTVKSIFSQVESIQLHTRYYLEETVNRVLDERLSEILERANDLAQ